MILPSRFACCMPILVGAAGFDVLSPKSSFSHCFSVMPPLLFFLADMSPIYTSARTAISILCFWCINQHVSLSHVHMWTSRNCARHSRGPLASLNAWVQYCAAGVTDTAGPPTCLQG